MTIEFSEGLKDYLENWGKMKLCWECKEGLRNRYGVDYDPKPSDHCHHDEPEEKPKPLVCCICGKPATSMDVGIKKLFCESHDASNLKPKCWCDGDRVLTYASALTTICGEPFKINFCPKCGRKLN